MGCEDLDVGGGGGVGGGAKKAQTTVKCKHRLWGQRIYNVYYTYIMNG